jgi:hypothetical protein
MPSMIDRRWRGRLLLLGLAVAITGMSGCGGGPAVDGRPGTEGVPAGPDAVPPVAAAPAANPPAATGSAPGGAAQDQKATPPVAIDQPKPELSDELTQGLAELETPVSAKLRVHIQGDGTVDEVEVLDVQPPGLEIARQFADEAAEQIKRWRYRPATRNGLPAESRVEFVVNAGPPAPTAP